MVQHPHNPDTGTDPHEQTLLLDRETREFPDPVRAGFRHGPLTPYAVGRVAVEPRLVGPVGRVCGVGVVGWEMRDWERGEREEGSGGLGGCFGGFIGGWEEMGRGGKGEVGGTWRAKGKVLRWIHDTL